MLSARILSTIKFFDLQDYPLTLFELHKFLIRDLEYLKPLIESNFELKANFKSFINPEKIQMGKLLECLENECQGQVLNSKGFYYLPNRKDIVELRLNNYYFGIYREKRIRRFLWLLKHMPFIRGVAVGGSQAMGRQKQSSDIDLLIITEKNFLWIARTLVTVYLQVFFVRRHSKYVTDRFCLNHYLNLNTELNAGRDLFNAMEYARLRPVVYSQTIENFKKVNSDWINIYFPNFEAVSCHSERQSGIQKILEKIFIGNFGGWLEKTLGQWQLGRIKKGEYVVATNNELSFYSVKRKRAFLASFFQNA